MLRDAVSIRLITLHSDRNVRWRLGRGPKGGDIRARAKGPAGALNDDAGDGLVDPRVPPFDLAHHRLHTVRKPIAESVDGEVIDRDNCYPIVSYVGNVRSPCFRHASRLVRKKNLERVF